MSIMRLRSLFLCALLCLPVYGSERARYDNYRVFKVSIEDAAQLQLMHEIENYPDGVSSESFDA